MIGAIAHRCPNLHRSSAGLYLPKSVGWIAKPPRAASLRGRQPQRTKMSQIEHGLSAWIAR